jgi:predicted 3-demethylubiquinone-9 3-methyltransferase (glyoxalase superfamily)
MFWDRLSEGGEKSQCGWLKDKYGLSWQVVPTALTKLMGDPDPAKSKAVLDAMLKMKKIVIADLQAAYDRAASH